MKILVRMIKYEELKFKNTNLLGLIVDNHDLTRFLSSKNNTIQSFKSALVFTMTIKGIPFIYYGSEQAFNANYSKNWNANREMLT